MARAYRHAAEQDGPALPELEALRMIDRFGAQAVFGRILSVREMRMMSLAERIVRAYHDRDAYRDADKNKNWAEWAAKNPTEFRLLNVAMRAANDS